MLCYLFTSVLSDQVAAFRNFVACANANAGGIIMLSSRMNIIAILLLTSTAVTYLVN